MHVLDLQDPIRSILYSANSAAINPRVEISCQAVEVLNGVRGTRTLPIKVDITDILSSDSINISTERPLLPTGDGTGMTGSQVNIEIIAPSPYWGVTQDGGQIDGRTIKNGFIDIYATVWGEEIKVYSGKIISKPSERAGYIGFTIRDNIFSIVSRKISYYHDPELLYYFTPDSEIVIGTKSINTNLQRIEWAAGHTYYNQDGQLTASVKADNKDVGLLALRYSGTVELKTGDIEINFVSDTAFEFNYKGVGTYSGNINSTFTVTLPGGTISINPEDWNIRDVEDPSVSGSTITLYPTLTMSGNPSTLIKNLLNRAFGGPALAFDVGNNFPDQVSYDSLDQIERIFNSFTLRVSEKDNISYKNIIDKICDHIGLAMTVDNSGRVSFTTVEPLPGRTVHDINQTMVEDYEIIASDSYETIRINYAYDLITQDYYNREINRETVPLAYEENTAFQAGSIVNRNDILYVAKVAIPAGSGGSFVGWELADEKSHTINLRYYSKLERTQIPHVFRAYSTIYDSALYALNILPNFGVSHEVGDQVNLALGDFDHVTGMYEGYPLNIPGKNVEIVRLNKFIGGKVKAEAVGRGDFCYYTMCLDEVDCQPYTPNLNPAVDGDGIDQGYPLKQTPAILITANTFNDPGLFIVDGQVYLDDDYINPMVPAADQEVTFEFWGDNGKMLEFTYDYSAIIDSSITVPLSETSTLYTRKDGSTISLTYSQLKTNQPITINQDGNISYQFFKRNFALANNFSGGDTYPFDNAEGMYIIIKVNTALGSAISNQVYFPKKRYSELFNRPNVTRLFDHVSLGRLYFFSDIFNGWAGIVTDLDDPVKRAFRPIYGDPASKGSYGFEVDDSVLVNGYPEPYRATDTGLVYKYSNNGGTSATEAANWDESFVGGVTWSGSYPTSGMWIDRARRLNGEPVIYITRDRLDAGIQCLYYNGAAWVLTNLYDPAQMTAHTSTRAMTQIGNDLYYTARRGTNQSGAIYKMELTGSDVFVNTDWTHTRIAGNINGGTSITDGPGLSATFGANISYIQGYTESGQPKLFAGFEALRKITFNGTSWDVTTICTNNLGDKDGVLGVEAGIRTPGGGCIDISTGTLYIASWQHQYYKIEGVFTGQYVKTTLLPLRHDNVWAGVFPSAGKRKTSFY